MMFRSEGGCPFVVCTGTWGGETRPAEAPRRYRQAAGTGARLTGMAMASNRPDPYDGGMADVAGFETGTLELITDFAR
jgi:hypothetical protein